MRDKRRQLYDRGNDNSRSQQFIRKKFLSFISRKSLSFISEKFRGKHFVRFTNIMSYETRIYSIYERWNYVI